MPVGEEGRGAGEEGRGAAGEEGRGAAGEVVEGAAGEEGVAGVEEHWEQQWQTEEAEPGGDREVINSCPPHWPCTVLT